MISLFSVEQNKNKVQLIRILFAFTKTIADDFEYVYLLIYVLFYGNKDIYNKKYQTNCMQQLAQQIPDNDT